jgi:hypothetical protein
MIISEKRRVRKNLYSDMSYVTKSVDMEYDYNFDELKQENDLDSATILDSINEEINLTHREILLQIGKGHCYDYISRATGIHSKNIRHHAFQAKSKLIKRLALKGYKVENNGYVRTKINLKHEVESSLLLDDWPIGERDYSKIIDFVFSKITKLTSHQAIAIIARNRSRSFSDIKSPFYKAIEKKIKKGEFKEEENYYIKL